MSHLNDTLQPLQVPQREAGNIASWSHKANGPVLLHSRKFEYLCEITRVPSSLLHPSSTSLSLITPSLVFTGLTGVVHVSLTPGCDLLPCYTTRQTDECSCESHPPSSMVTQTVTRHKSAMLLYVCIAIYWLLLRARMLLTQMLVLRLCI